MNLITIQFEVSVEKQADFIQEQSNLSPFWEQEGFTYSLYRDTHNPNRFYMTLSSEKTVDELTALIQENSKAKFAFENIKASSGHIVISFLEKVA